MSKHPFKWLGDREIILVTAILPQDIHFRLALDTGSTMTVFDLNMLLIEGIDLRKSLGRQAIETANGIIEGDIFEVESFKAIGHETVNFQFVAIDFVQHGIFSGYSGMLGLDFLSQKSLCVHFDEQVLTFA